MSSLIPADDDPEDTGELLFYRTEDGQNRIQLRLHGGTVWLTQKQLSELYQVSVKTVNEHLVTLYDDGELSPEATIRKFRIVQFHKTATPHRERPPKQRTYPPAFNAFRALGF